MPHLDLHSFSLWTNLGIFFGAAVLVWIAGTRLAYSADGIAEKTILGYGFVGAVLLASATSLPELATSLTAAHLGDAALAINNLMGGIAMQIAILAVMDFIFLKKALTYFSGQPVLLMNGVLMIVLIAMAMAGISLGDRELIFEIGMWPILLFGAYILYLYVIRKYEGKNKWAPVDLPDESDRQEHEKKRNTNGYQDVSKFSLWASFFGFGLLVLVAGYTVSQSVHAISKQTALSSSFLGGTLAAISTSLPELSTTAGAIKRKAYTMAFANIFGSNSIMMGLFLYADMVYRQGPIFDQYYPTALFFGAVGIMAGSFYLWGILERRDKAICRLGLDSWLVLATYFGGLILVYFWGRA